MCLPVLKAEAPPYVYLPGVSQREEWSGPSLTKQGIYVDRTGY